MPIKRVRVTVPLWYPSALFAAAAGGTFFVLTWLALLALVLWMFVHFPQPGPAPAPVPPAPTPTPVPPPPPPVPPAPIPAAGLRVLIVYDSADASKLPPAQLNVLYAAAVRDYLNAHCVAGAGGQKEWRIWDAGVDASGEAQLWQDALKRPHASLPWVLVSDGRSGFEGPLPATVDDFLALVKKYGS